MIVAERLTKRFGRVTAVDSIDLEVLHGDVVGLLGPNGAGKTTTIRMITGFLPPTSGMVAIDGFDSIRDSLEVRRRIGYLPESTPLYTEMRVGEFLGYRGRLYGLGRRQRRERVAEVIERCWLGEVRRRPIGQLSKGYRQRVGLASAMLHRPPVLILDEPSVGLDPAQIRAMRGLIRELAGDHTVLLSTHILPEVELTCDRVVVMAGGKVRAHGTIEELRGSASRRPRYVVETDTDQARQRLSQIPGADRVESEQLDGRWCRMIVTASGDAPDLRQPIAAALGDLSAVTRELRREAPSLEHLFLEIAEGGAAPAAIVGGPA